MTADSLRVACDIPGNNTKMRFFKLQGCFMLRGGHSNRNFGFV